MGDLVLRRSAPAVILRAEAIPPKVDVGAAQSPSRSSMSSCAALPTVDSMPIDSVPVTAAGINSEGSLQATLGRMLRSGVDSNAALNALIRDYTTFHIVLVFVGGLFLLGLVTISIVFWSRFARTRTSDVPATTFERATYVSFGVLSVVVGLFLALVVAANVSSVANPRQGLSGAVGMLGHPRAGTPTGDFQQAVVTWLESGNAEVPARVQDRIDDRLAWQRPKAIVCSVMLLVALAISVQVWRSLVRRSRSPARGGTPATGALLVVGVATVVASLLLMLMVMGNTQGSIAPLSLTLFLG